MLGIVLILMAAVLAAGVFAFWGLKSDTGAAGNDRLARQLFDCAEQGLAVGKEQFSYNLLQDVWDKYFKANVCASGSVSCPPLLVTAPGSSVDGYPDQPPFWGKVTTPAPQSIELEYHVAIYNNPENPPSPFHDTDNRIIIYSRCIDKKGSGQSRAVQAIIERPPTVTNDYTGQAGRGFRNQGNSNF
jgi:hypothetical protein